ncbi:MAG: YlxR family protein [Actinomycetia bacterium]|nr:YlxR family protein [Actinomycetes bacterium]
MGRGGRARAAGEPHVPLRTCVGCRRHDERAHLLRYVAVDGRLVADPGKRAPGRGAWVHDDPACWAAALKRKAFGRTLRTPVTVIP